MANPMASIKKKIQTLKDECDDKDDRIEILERKLKEEVDKRENVEEERNKLENRNKLAEEKCDYLEEHLGKLQTMLTALENEKDDRERELRKHICDEETTADTTYQLNEEIAVYKAKYDNLVECSEELEGRTRELKEAQKIAEVADSKYEEVSRKCQVLTDEVMRAEEQAEKYQCQCKESELHILNLTSELQSARAQERSMSEEHDKLESKVHDLERIRAELEALCEEKSLRCEKLKQEVDMLEVELEKSETIKNQLQQEMDVMVLDLQSM